MANIKQMFSQIKMSPEDFHHQAILWRFNPEDPVQIFYLTIVTYGLICLSFLATCSLCQFASDTQTKLPLPHDVSIECNIDDMLSGGHSIEITIEKQTQLINTLKEDGLELREWLSNEPRILSHLPVEHLASDASSIFETSASFAVLGLNWHAGNDTGPSKAKFAEESEEEERV